MSMLGEVLPLNTEDIPARDREHFMNGNHFAVPRGIIRAELTAG